VFPDASPPPEVVALVARLVEERAGLHYGPESVALFADKAAARAREVGFPALLDYYYFLHYDPAGRAELDTLVEALVVHETYFFREADALRVAVREYVAPAVRAAGSARVWCAACATGEEPLTLAMLLDDAGLLPAVELVASDVSASAVARAQRGEFFRRALRALPPESRRHLTVEDDRGVVRPELVAAVRWRRVNLIEPAAVAALGAFDLVLCRNVLIYFSEATVGAVVGSLAHALRPEGRLLVGVSESLLRLGTLLRCEERGGVFAYRRSP
jgi:chemotaxis protein methyltransferase CheR